MSREGNLLVKSMRPDFHEALQGLFDKEPWRRKFKSETIDGHPAAICQYECAKNSFL